MSLLGLAVAAFSGGRLGPADHIDTFVDRTTATWYETGRRATRAAWKENLDPGPWWANARYDPREAAIQSRAYGAYENRAEGGFW